MPAVPKPEIIHDDEYRAFIRGLPCVRCSEPGEPHHVRHSRGYGEKKNLVPLCRTCHDEGHLVGWRTWQMRVGVKLQPIANCLWAVWTERRI